jgi:hypothetical protein
MKERMGRLKIALGFGVLALLCAIHEPVAADVIHLGSGQRLTNVQVLSKNWRGYEVELTAGGVTIFFSRDEIVGVERDDIEPGRDARRSQEEYTEPGQSLVPFQGDEVSPEMSASLQVPVNLRFENNEITDIVRTLSEAYGIKLVLDPAVMEPGGLDDTTWTVNFEGAQFITVIQQLVTEKGLDYRIEGETITLHKPVSPAPDDGSP